MNILIISKEKDILKKLLITQIGNNHQIFTTDNSIRGLSLYNKVKPSVLLIDDNLEKINGIVFCKILKELMVKDSISYKDLTIFMFLSKQNFNNNKLKDLNINYFITKPIDKDLFTLQIAAFFNNFKLGFSSTLEETVKKAQINQAETLPDFICKDDLTVDYIYSPYLNLSGDLFKYWLDEEKNNLYGYLFDCKGHDLIAWRQTAKIKTVFNYAFRFYDKSILKTLTDVMNSINEEILLQMDMDSDTNGYVVAIIFKLDIKNKKLYYIPAGMPNILLKKNENKNYTEVALCSNLLGFDKKSYKEEVLDVTEVEEIIFCTDGLSDLFTFDIQSKKDDITAIFIKQNNCSNRTSITKEA